MQVRIHYHRPAKGTTVFEERLVLDRPEVKVTLLPAFDGEAVSVNGTTILSAGAPVVWSVFPNEWYDVGRFHLTDGTFTGCYTNLREPMHIDGTDWRCSDFFLDHWLPVGGAGTWLDEDELDRAIDQELLDDATHTRLLAERRSIDIALQQGSWPPPITREINLAHAMAKVGR